MHVRLLYIKQLTALKTAFCQVILDGKCAQAGIEHDRFGLVENTFPFDIRKFRKFKVEVLVDWNTPINWLALRYRNHTGWKANVTLIDSL